MCVCECVETLCATIHKKKERTREKKKKDLPPIQKTNIDTHMHSQEHTQHAEQPIFSSQPKGWPKILERTSAHCTQINYSKRIIQTHSNTSHTLLLLSPASFLFLRRLR